MRFAVTSLVMLLVADSARAQDPPAAAQERVSPVSATRRTPYVAARVNPLSLLIRRASGEVEVWPTPALGVFVGGYHGTTESSSRASSDDDRDGVNKSLSASGFETGARFWGWSHSNARTKFGWFLGSSVGYAAGSTRTSITPQDRSAVAPAPSSSEFSQWTGAVDGGVGLYVSPFFLLAGGGFQMVWNHHEPTGACGGEIVCIDNISVRYGDGIRPRFLLSLGLAL